MGRCTLVDAMDTPQCCLAQQAICGEENLSSGNPTFDGTVYFGMTRWRAQFVARKHWLMMACLSDSRLIQNCTACITFQLSGRWADGSPRMLMAKLSKLWDHHQWCGWTCCSAASKSILSLLALKLFLVCKPQYLLISGAIHDTAVVSATEFITDGTVNVIPTQVVIKVTAAALLNLLSIRSSQGMGELWRAFVRQQARLTTSSLSIPSATINSEQQTQYSVTATRRGTWCWER